MSDEVKKAMPKVDVGMDVWWYPHGDVSQEPLAAKVTRRGFDSVCVAIFHPDNYNLMIRDGVRHVSDGRARDNQDVIDSGLWDYPRGEAYKDLDRRLKAVEKLTAFKQEVK